MLVKEAQDSWLAVIGHLFATVKSHDYIDGLVQDCDNSSILAMVLLQSYAKPLTCQFS